MRQINKFGIITGLAITLGFFAMPLEARLELHFSLDECTWNTTEVVLVEVTANDTVFTVLKTFKGHLRPGESITVPKLKPEDNAIPMSDYPKPINFSSPVQVATAEQIPRQPAGSQLILFLKKSQESDANSSETDDLVGTTWDAGSKWVGLKLSTIWIDRGIAFCFEQFEFPGPRTLSPCYQPGLPTSDADVFIARIREILKVQQDLAGILPMKDAQARAQRLGSIALGDVYEAHNEAIDALGQSGAVALPEIMQVMDSPPGIDDGDSLIRAFVMAAGKDSGRFLQARLQQDVDYWKSIGPTLSRGWMEQLSAPATPLYVKFHETLRLVGELDRERYVAAAATVADMRDFWISQPQLYDQRWRADGSQGEDRTSITGADEERAASFDLVAACDVFLKHAGA
jgi:hypothetical protein